MRYKYKLTYYLQKKILVINWEVYFLKIKCILQGYQILHSSFLFTNVILLYVVNKKHNS